MGDRNREGIGCRPGPPGYTAWQIGSLESVLGLLKSLKIRAQGEYRIELMQMSQNSASHRILHNVVLMEKESLEKQTLC